LSPLSPILLTRGLSDELNLLIPYDVGVAVYISLFCVLMDGLHPRTSPSRLQRFLMPRHAATRLLRCRPLWRLRTDRRQPAWGPQTNDLVLQLAKRRINKIILGGMLANASRWVPIGAWRPGGRRAGAFCQCITW
jgi:hypothetical protein